MDETNSTGSSNQPRIGFLKRAIGLTYLGVALNRIAKEQESQEIPNLVKGSELGILLRSIAIELVKQEVCDYEAISELTAASKGHVKDLEIATRLAKISGEWIEMRDANRVVRLLESAVTGIPVEAPSFEQEQLFNALDEWLVLPRDQIFSQLKSLVKQLIDLEEQVGKECTELGTKSFESALERSFCFSKYRVELRERLHGLVGPKSYSSDIVVRSRWAHSFASMYLSLKLPYEKKIK